MSKCAWPLDVRTIGAAQRRCGRPTLPGSERCEKHDAAARRARSRAAVNAADAESDRRMLLRYKVAIADAVLADDAQAVVVAVQAYRDMAKRLAELET